MHFAANISTLFTALPPLARIAAAAQAGFRGVEMQFPYEHEPAALAAAAREAGVRFALINMPAGDFGNGERGTACIPGRELEFQAGIMRATDYAMALECRRVNCLAGNLPAGADAATCRALLVNNLRLAADAFAPHGITLLLEPLNRVDNPSFILHGTEDALSIIHEADRPNLALQLDTYHSAMAGEDGSDMLARHVGQIGHIQISDCPGRGAPGTGTLDFARFFGTLSELAYRGWIGCEYTGSEPDFAWMRRYALTP